MNPLLKKEIRLVLPAALAVLLLGVWHPWFFRELDQSIALAPAFIFLGMVLLAVDSFGREFSLGTFASLMSQPVDRRRIWRTKLGVLAAAAVLIYAASLASWLVRLHVGPGDYPLPSRVYQTAFHDTLLRGSVAVLVALVGGLWTALFVRQVSAAFWITLLAPMLLIMLVAFSTSFLSNAVLDEDFGVIVFVVMCLYAGAAFWLARRLFYRAEDAGWTGGVISFSQWRYFERADRNAVSARYYRPLAALAKKELQLHSISLFGAGVLLGLHILVFFIRNFYSVFHQGTITALITDSFWCLWLILPLVIGCTTAAEERKLGVSDSQFCLPVSRRRQFIVKFLPAMFFGVLLGGIMPLLLEHIAGAVGAPSDYLKPQSHTYSEFGSGLVWFQAGVIGLATGLAALGLFASTLARNFLQALSIAIIILIGISFVDGFVVWLGESRVTLFGLMPMPWILFVLIGLSMGAGTFLWLADRNFVSWHETGRLWKRNLAGFAVVVLFTITASGFIYDRAWELAAPLEPAHGRAVLPLPRETKVSMPSTFNFLQVLLPGGRVWCGSVECVWMYQDDPWVQLMMMLENPVPAPGGPMAFVAGSNWASVASGSACVPNFKGAGDIHYTELVGIRADGSLWISRNSDSHNWNGADMVQWGTETNWLQITRWYNGFILLKTDGTLWLWAAPPGPWPRMRLPASVRGVKPQRWHPFRVQDGTWPIDPGTGWRELACHDGDYLLRNADGTVWRLELGDAVSLAGRISRAPELNQARLDTVTEGAFIGRDGTLQINRHWNSNVRVWEGSGYVQAGEDTNWVSVSWTLNRLVTLKSDGTLWQWDLTNAKSAAEAASRPPVRLGFHNDWVALAGLWGSTATLAADGSLWLWADEQDDRPYMMRLSRHPHLLGNVLAEN